MGCYDPQANYAAQKLMTMRDAAEYLRVCLKTIQRLKRAKQLRPRQPGKIRSPRFTKRDLDKLLIAD